MASNIIFTIIVPVYNVEGYLKESIDSIINQTFDINSIEIILIDDGSSDSSGRICDEYSKKYDNIITIHIKNSGVSAARNVGLQRACGKYIGFLDSDDKFSVDVIEKVHSFFIKNSDVDVTSIPRIYFDGQTGDHILNDKFKKGTRVIDLNSEYNMLQNSVTFFTKNSIEDVFFDEKLKYSEDTKFVLTVLNKNRKLGVVSDCCYYYRKRTDGNKSAVDTAKYRSDWYLPTLFNFSEYMVQMCLEGGKLPKFIQFAIIYEISWKFRVEHVPNYVLSRSELNEYLCSVSKLLWYVDDNIILEQKTIYAEHKIFLLKLKYRTDPTEVLVESDLLYKLNNRTLFKYSRNLITVEFLELSNNYLEISGKVNLYPPMKDISLDIISDDGREICCDLFDRCLDKYSFDVLIRSGVGFKSNILIKKPTRLSFRIKYRGHQVLMTNISLGKHVKILSNNVHFSNNSKWGISFNGHELFIINKTLKKLISSRYCCLKSAPFSGIEKVKSCLLSIFITLLKSIHCKPLWLISDRINRAGDNGEALFKYVANNGNNRVYFVISGDSIDYKRLKQYGSVVPYGSKKHKILFGLCDFNISSHADLGMLNPFGKHDKYYLSDIPKFIFLQHGVTKDDVSLYLNRYDKNIKGLIVTSRDEHYSFAFEKYGYEWETIWEVGFPRFDYLPNGCEKIITFMPTWRAHLVSSMDSNGRRKINKNAFINSSFYKNYCSLFNDPDLFNLAESKGYTIQVLYHPNMSDVSDLIPHDIRLKILPSDSTYSDVYAQSALIVTDYSSAVFDFSYLKKPVLYYQPDFDEFFSGSHTYSRGYFSYEADGFGEVENTSDSLKYRIHEYLDSDCKLKSKYQERINKFFTFIDKNNCLRVCNRIDNYHKVLKVRELLLSSKNIADERQKVDFLEKIINQQDDPYIKAIVLQELGLYYYNIKNYKKMVSCLSRSSTLGSISSRYLLFKILWNLNDSSLDELLFTICSEMSMTGDLAAETYVGLCYANGRGVGKDTVKAIAYLENAIRFGHCFVWKDLVSCYISQNTIEYAEKCCDLLTHISKTINDPEPMYLLGAHIFKNFAKEMDIDLARYWLSRAYYSNYPRAATDFIDLLIKIGTSESKYEAFLVAIESSKKNNSGAMGRLGRMYRDGIGTSVNLDKAKYWFREASLRSKFWEDELNLLNVCGD